MREEAPLVLHMRFDPEREPAPIDAADILQSFDDAERLAERIFRYGDISLEEFATNIQSQWLIGASASPLTIERVDFGSPLDIVVTIPWEVAGYGGIWFVLAQLERFWNMSKRIQVESKRLDAEKAQHERDQLEAEIDGYSSTSAIGTFATALRAATSRGRSKPPPSAGWTEH